MNSKNQIYFQQLIKKYDEIYKSDNSKYAEEVMRRQMIMEDTLFWTAREKNIWIQRVNRCDEIREQHIQDYIMFNTIPNKIKSQNEQIISRVKRQAANRSEPTKSQLNQIWFELDRLRNNQHPN